jgi:hypothetical protein
MLLQAQSDSGRSGARVITDCRAERLLVRLGDLDPVDEACHVRTNVGPYVITRRARPGP